VETRWIKTIWKENPIHPHMHPLLGKVVQKWSKVAEKRLPYCKRDFRTSRIMRTMPRKIPVILQHTNFVSLQTPVTGTMWKDLPVFLRRRQPRSRLGGDPLIHTVYMYVILTFFAVFSDVS